MKKTLLIIAALALMAFTTFVFITYFGTTMHSPRNNELETSTDLSVAKKPSEVESIVLDYFNDITLGSEYGDTPRIIQKWNQSFIDIAVNGSYSVTSRECLDQTIIDFNMLSKDVKLRRTLTNPDISIYFAPENTFSSILKEYEPTNLGYFWTWNDGYGVLNKATVMIDTSRISETERCHLIREELTQSLGFMNDSSKYPDSVFYNDWTHTSTYSEIDKKIISILYGDDRIKPGMQRTDIEKLFIRQ